jgi:sterol desaturase/sphingolipid hydroxylase (fatty acid hydroxylase superfamily)
LELKGELGARIHFIFHGVHHDYPSDSRRLVMPPSVSIPLATLFYFLFRFLIGDISVHPFFAGFLTGYLFYDITHYAVHHFNMHSKFWLAIKNHHIKHHFQDPDKGYGVSSPIWDYVFRTNYLNKEEQKA